MNPLPRDVYIYRPDLSVAITEGYLWGYTSENNQTLRGSEMVSALVGGRASTTNSIPFVSCQVRKLHQKQSN